MPETSKPIRWPRWIPRWRQPWKPNWAIAHPAEPLKLSVILICYKMEGQIGNTLTSLLPPYQCRAKSASNSDENREPILIADYEILLIDNGSPAPLEPSVWRLSDNIVYTHIPPGQANGNPGVAINAAAQKARGDILCIMIDGARMLTPGVLSAGVRLAGLGQRSFVEVRGWHLGPKLQSQSVSEGYNSDVEKSLLNFIKWPRDGYRLFDIAVPAQSCADGYWGKATETTCCFIKRQTYLEAGGYDERYTTPGGGLTNFDFFYRMTTHADRVYSLLYEGTFHQIHGGAATGLSDESRRATFRQWRAEYERLSRRFKNEPPPYKPVRIAIS